MCTVIALADKKRRRHDVKTHEIVTWLRGTVDADVAVACNPLVAASTLDGMDGVVTVFRQGRALGRTARGADGHHGADLARSHTGSCRRLNVENCRISVIVSYH